MCSTIDGPLSSRVSFKQRCNPRQWPCMQKENDDLSESELYLASCWQLALATVRWPGRIMQQLCFWLQGNVNKQPSFDPSVFLKNVFIARFGSHGKKNLSVLFWGEIHLASKRRRISSFPTYFSPSIFITFQVLFEF